MPSNPAMPRVDVHFSRLDIPEAEVTRLARLLNAAERDRAGRFRFAVHRRRFIVRRARLRLWLSRELAIAPALVPLRAAAGGKPEVPGWGRHFNTSHSGDVMLIASGPVPVGCDIEEIVMDTPWRDIAGHLFAPEERQTLAQLDDIQGRQAFFRCWARKEAFVKALGLGLAYPLDAFAVSCGPSATLPRGGEGWTIAALDEPDHAPDHAGAIVAQADGTPLVVRVG